MAAIVLATLICLVGTCAQGRLKHVILWLLGAVPRERPSFSATIPRREHYWAVIGRLDYEAPEEPPPPASSL